MHGGATILPSLDHIIAQIWSWASFDVSDASSRWKIHWGRGERRVVLVSASRGGVCVWVVGTLCVFELGERKGEEGLLLMMLPAWLLSPPWTLLACCFSKHEGPEMSQVEPAAATAHPGAKVKTTTFRHTIHKTCTSYNFPVLALEFKKQ